MVFVFGPFSIVFTIECYAKPLMRSFVFDSYNRENKSKCFVFGFSSGQFFMEMLIRYHYDKSETTDFLSFLR